MAVKFFVAITLILGLISLTEAQITFTGNAKNDFTNLSAELSRNTYVLTLPAASNNIVPTGADLLGVYFHYDYPRDQMFIGVQCNGICGDIDGDGNPDVDSNPSDSIVDAYNWTSTETLTIAMWAQPSSSWTPATNVFLPTAVFGIQENAGANVDIRTGSSKCTYEQYLANKAACTLNSLGGTSPSLAWLWADTPISPSKIVMSKVPSASWPSLEWTISDVSKLPGFTFTPGYNVTRFAFRAFSGTETDGVGEDFTPATVVAFDCPIGYDRCQVCGGSNACVDCQDVAFGTSSYDRCGVCDGNNACVDCQDVEFGTSSYDRCGVCDGTNDCVDCQDVPFGTSSYDRCGVCDGTNDCVDCQDIPFGTSSYDRCGVCDGTNDCVDCQDVEFGTSSYDRCGVCDGTNDCVDCQDIPFGTSSYDRCGVCDGTNDCVDCFDVEFGTSSYDRCGVCDGTNDCVDCQDIPFGTSSYDRCGVCDGTNDCIDCFDIPFGTSSYDRCGVCDGTNDCVDCQDVPFGTSSYDRCGVCDGTNDCVDCFDIPFGTSSYDRCGVCDGNNLCVDCFNVEGGTSQYDRCGVCDGNNDCVDCNDVEFGTSSYDRCGVCDGTNDCVDCFDVEFGTSTYDRCGVCDGTNDCVDCFDVEFGTSQYDRCGVCDGDNECIDCFDIPFGTSSYDRCGVCDGTNDCIDCFDIPFGTSKYDRCGVCDGKNDCIDCFNIPFGTSSYDRCGVCDGDNACVDCADKPFGTGKYDRCGVCNGNGKSCLTCPFYTKLVFDGFDTYVDLAARADNFDQTQTLPVSSDYQRTLSRFDDIRYRVGQISPYPWSIVNATVSFMLNNTVALPEQGWLHSEIGLHVIPHGFCAETASWDCRDIDETDCCVNWRMIPIGPIQVSYTEPAAAVRRIVDGMNGALEFNVTSDIVSMLQGSLDSSRSYLLKKECEDDAGHVLFRSCETGYCPQLTIWVMSDCRDVIVPTPDPCPYLDA